ncbi:MAG TPA: NAD(P)-binding domain-containing protein [Pseudolabrys sp.]|nr:NAD(P)-binding domain-containing protein [Pseudolabrys sp.]
MREQSSTTVDRRALLGAGGLLAVATILQPAQLRAQGSSPTRIGVIGSGNIGGTIGGLWVKKGHPVFFSSRHPEELKDMIAKLGSLANAGTVEEAVTFGDVLFIAVPYGAIPQIGKDYSAKMKGKVMLDACNAVSTRDGAIADEVEQNGIGVTTQKYFPGVRIVRAFNTMSYMVFAREANRLDPKLAIPIAGDDPQAVQIAAALVRDAGFDPVTVGTLADARRFQRGQPGYGQQVSAAELKQKLSLP